MRRLNSTILIAILLLVVLVGTGVPQAGAQSAPRRYVDLVFDQVERSNDVKYGTAIDIPSGQSVDLRLDIYEPAGDTETARPVFIFYFGGGFVSGNKELEPRVYCELMARRGYVAVAPSYRINQGDLGTVGIPAAISDARQSVNWLIEHAEEHRLDPSRIVIGGSSAGSITALFTAYTDRVLEAGDRSQEVALVMDLWGGLYTDVNEMESGEPPLIIIHGTADTVVPYSEGEKLRDRAQAVGIPYEFHPLQGLGHAPWMPEDLMTRVANFAYDILWTSVPSPSPTPEPSATLEPDPTVSPSPTVVATLVPTALPTNPTSVPRLAVYLPLLRNN